jgi:hypothetical protein
MGIKTAIVKIWFHLLTHVKENTSNVFSELLEMKNPGISHKFKNEK